MQQLAQGVPQPANSQQPQPGPSSHVQQVAQGVPQSATGTGFWGGISESLLLTVLLIAVMMPNDLSDATVSFGGKEFKDAEFVKLGLAMFLFSAGLNQVISFGGSLCCSGQQQTVLGGLDIAPLLIHNAAKSIYANGSEKGLSPAHIFVLILFWNTITKVATAFGTVMMVSERASVPFQWITKVIKEHPEVFNRAYVLFVASLLMSCATTLMDTRPLDSAKEPNEGRIASYFNLVAFIGTTIFLFICNMKDMTTAIMTITTAIPFIVGLMTVLFDFFGKSSWTKNLEKSEFIPLQYPWINKDASLKKLGQSTLLSKDNWNVVMSNLPVSFGLVPLVNMIMMVSLNLVASIMNFSVLADGPVDIDTMKKTLRIGAMANFATSPIGGSTSVLSVQASQIVQRKKKNVDMPWHTLGLAFVYMVVSYFGFSVSNVMPKWFISAFMAEGSLSLVKESFAEDWSMLKNDEKMIALATVTVMVMVNDLQDSSSPSVQTLGACAIGLGATVGVLLSTVAKEFSVNDANPGKYWAASNRPFWQFTGFLDGKTAAELEKDVESKLDNALQQESVVFDFRDSPQAAGVFTENFKRVLVKIVQKWKSENINQTITILLPKKSCLSFFWAATAKFFIFVVTVLLGLKMFIMPTSAEILLGDLKSITPTRVETIMPDIRAFLIDWRAWFTMAGLALAVSLQNNIVSQMYTVKAYVDKEFQNEEYIEIKHLQPGPDASEPLLFPSAFQGY